MNFTFLYPIKNFYFFIEHESNSKYRDFITTFTNKILIGNKRSVDDIYCDMLDEIVDHIIRIFENDKQRVRNAIFIMKSDEYVQNILHEFDK